MLIFSNLKSKCFCLFYLYYIVINAKYLNLFKFIFNKTFNSKRTFLYSVILILFLVGKLIT